MPYTPPFGTDKRQAVSQHFPEYRPLTDYHPQSVQSALSLPKASSRLVRYAVIGGGVLFGLLVLANMAFTPAAMHRFWLGVGSEMRWLTGSQKGNSVGAFTLLGLIVVGSIGFARHKIIRNHGSAAFGWCQIMPGVVLICGGGAGWYHGHIGWLVAGGMCFAGYILAGLGFRNIQANIQPAPVAQPPAPMPERPPMPVHQASADTYGSGRMATPEEVDRAWRGGSNNGGFDKIFED